MIYHVYVWDEQILPGDRTKNPTSSVTLSIDPKRSMIRQTREFWLPNGLDLEWGHDERRWLPGTGPGPAMSVRRDGACFNEMIPFLLGFLHDLGLHERLDPDGENLLVRNEWEGCRAVRWPKVVDDEVWEAMYQIEPPPAIPSDMHRSGDVPMWDFGEKGRGQNATDLLLDRLPFSRVLLQSTSSQESPTRIWSPVTCVDGSHTQHGTWKELLDAFFYRACVVRRSGLDDWMRENVVRGVFLLPTPDEVEVYRMLGEQLPLLWPDDRLIPWMEENWLRGDEP